MRYKQHLQMLFLLFKVYRIWAGVTSDIFGRFVKSQYTHYSSCVMLRIPLGAMVSSPDQTPQVPFMLFLIIHYFERPAPRSSRRTFCKMRPSKEPDVRLFRIRLFTKRIIQQLSFVYADIHSSFG